MSSKKLFAGFQKAFNSLTPKEKVEVLQCIIRDIEVYKDRLVLNVYEMPGFGKGSQKNNIWLRW